MGGNALVVLKRRLRLSPCGRNYPLAQPKDVMIRIAGLQIHIVHMHYHSITILLANADLKNNFRVTILKYLTIRIH